MTRVQCEHARLVSTLALALAPSLSASLPPLLPPALPLTLMVIFIIFIFFSCVVVWSEACNLAVALARTVVEASQRLEFTRSLRVAS